MFGVTPFTYNAEQTETSSSVLIPCSTTRNCPPWTELPWFHRGLSSVTEYEQLDKCFTEKKERKKSVQMRRAQQTCSSWSFSRQSVSASLKPQWTERANRKWKFSSFTAPLSAAQINGLGSAIPEESGLVHSHVPDPLSFDLQKYSCLPPKASSEIKVSKL